MLEDMSRLQRIVLAIDFSEGSDAATEVASELATAHGASITLVHVFELPLDFGMCEALVESGVEVQDRIAVAARQALEGQRRQLASLGISATVLLRMGPPSQKIHNVAVDLGADLIVIGMQGRIGRVDAIGSVAERVVRTATRPVLMVPMRGPQSGARSSAPAPGPR
jgi:nucleotide-binding universal stress UspA family protein